MGTNTSVEITHQTFSQALKDEQSAKDSTQINVGSLNISLPTYISEKARIFDIFQKAFYKGKKPLFFFFLKLWQKEANHVKEKHWVISSK